MANASPLLDYYKKSVRLQGVDLSEKGRGYLSPRSGFVQHLGLHGPEDLMADYKRRDASGQHADFGIGRRYLRMAMCMMRTSQVYLPPHLRKDEYSLKDRAGYYLTVWPYFRDKWKKVGAFKTAFATDRPLGIWRQIVQQLYDIELKY